MRELIEEQWAGGGGESGECLPLECVFGRGNGVLVGSFPCAT